jgi:hypothetical protein
MVSILEENFGHNRHLSVFFLLQIRCNNMHVVERAPIETDVSLSRSNHVHTSQMAVLRMRAEGHENP